jgi:hypothetical protein
MRVIRWCAALLLCLASSAEKAKLTTINKKELSQLAGVRKKDKKGYPAHSCGVVLQMLHPNMSNDDQVQMKDVAARNRLSNTLLKVSKAVSGAGKSGAVAFAKFPFKSNKLWLDYHTEGIFHTDWDDTLVAFFEENKDVKNEFLTEQIMDTSAVGVARFLNKKCKTNIKEVDGQTTAKPKKTKPKQAGEENEEEEKPKEEL